MSYTHEWTVRFGDTDSFGIAFYPRIVEAVHETSDRFMEAVGYPYWELTEEHGLGLPIVEVDVEFERPVRAGERVRIELTPTVGESSVRFDYEAFVDGNRVFAGYEQRVCARTGVAGSEPLTQEIRAAIESGAE